MSTHVLQILGYANIHAGQCPLAGLYVRVFDATPLERNEPMILDCTPNPDEALKATPAGLRALWMTEIDRPQPSGQPNRPLTAFTVSMLPLNDARMDYLRALRKLSGQE